MIGGDSVSQRMRAAGIFAHTPIPHQLLPSAHNQPSSPKGDLELAPHFLGVAVTQQMVGHRLGVGRGIEGLAAADAGQRAGGDVAHRVAAGLAGGDAHGRQPAHEIGRVFDVDVVQLHVLAGGDVADGVGVLLGDVGEDIHLSRVQAPEGYLDALHARRIPHGLHALGRRGGKRQAAVGDAVVALAVVITLAVGAAAQPRLGEQLVLDLALLLELDLAFEDVDFAREIERHPVCEAFFPASQCRWYRWLGVKVPRPRPQASLPMAGTKDDRPRAKGAQRLGLDFLRICIFRFG